MAESNGQYQKLPPGWDCKFDQATGNCYYINYFTKVMQLEDPRTRYKQLQNERCSTESIPMQPLHGSPYHVYPSNNLPAMRAFQAITGPGTHPSLQNMSSSPLLSYRGHLEMSPLPFPRSALMQTPRMANMSRRSTIQETSFSSQFDTDAVVAKIQNMFPTASENHIRLLLKKYYNREAVVISALQVEKHPVTMPGPFVTPPAQRHLFHSNSTFYMTPPARRFDIGTTSRLGFYGGNGGGSGSVGASGASGLGGSTSRTATPIPGGRFGSVMSVHSGRGCDVGAGSGSGLGYGYVALPFHGSPRYGEQWRASPKPHSSPKMKLRYMKNIFPKADEMLLLDILAGADNNVQQASEKLLSMGYVKRDFLAQKTTTRLEAELVRMPRSAGDEQIIPLHPKEYTPEEKDAMQARLREKYPQIAERIVLMALESVNYSEDRAIQILQIVQEEDEARAKKLAAELEAINEQLLVTQVDGTAAVSSARNIAGESSDNIITVVLETTPATNDASNNNTNRAIAASSSTAATNGTKKQRKFPSINVTTPTTATTQIILSNSPQCIGSEEEMKPLEAIELNIKADREAKQGHHSNKHSTASTSSSESSTAALSSPPSSSSSYPSTSTTSCETETASLTTLFQKLTTKSILAHSNSNGINIKGYLNGSSNSSKSSAHSASKLEKLKLSRSRDKSDSLNLPAVSITAPVRGFDSIRASELPIHQNPTADMLRHAYENSQRNSTEEEVDHAHGQEFKTLLGRISTRGHNNKLTKGPDEKLLLADYVTWNGANPDISTGQKQISTGPDPAILSERPYAALGRNPELCKGPKLGLAKGSIYAQLSAGSSKSNNIKCN